MVRHPFPVSQNGELDHGAHHHAEAGRALHHQQTLIQNGNKPAKFYVKTQCRMLRESESISEEEVDTICKRMWMTLQVIHLNENSADSYPLLLSQISEITNVVPGSAAFISAIIKALDEKNTHKALKEVKLLVKYESEIAAKDTMFADIA